MKINYRRETRAAAARNQRPAWHDPVNRNTKYEARRTRRAVERRLLFLVRIDPACAEDTLFPCKNTEVSDGWNWD
jgi:hypothetical protein